MLNTNVKVIYSLRVHIALQQQGFKYITEMRNPQNPHLNCWVYEATPALYASLNTLLGEGGRND